MTKLVEKSELVAWETSVGEDGETLYTRAAPRAEPVRFEMKPTWDGLSRLLARVDKFNRIARRYGQEVSARHVRDEQKPHWLLGWAKPVPVPVWEVTVPPLVGVKGRILAHFERGEGGKGQYVHCFDEERRAEAETFLPRAGQCDHCGKRRVRNHSYVCEVEGRVLMVGSACLLDFLGIDPAWALACCEWFEAKRGDADYDDDRPHGSKTRVDTAELVETCYRVARKHGGYSREIGDVMHTEVGCLMFPGPDKTTAEVKAKYKDFHPVFDRDEFARYIEKASGDFGANLRMAVMQDWVETKRIRLVLAGVGLFVGRAMKREEDAKKPVVITREFEGDKGQRIDFEAEIIRTYVRDGAYGETCIITLRTDDGRQAVNFHTGRDRPEAGKRYQVRGTVKRHQAAFKGQGRETIFARCTYKEIK